MKGKKLEKLIRKLIISIERERNDMTKSEIVENQVLKNDHMFTECDDAQKNKIRNLIIRLLHHRDEIDYNISENYITLSQYEKKLSKKSTHSTSTIRNSYFHLEIIKDSGFVLNCNDRKILMKDVTLFDEIKPKIKEIFDKINQDNFNELYNVIMKDSGLNRESNLDEILSAF